jgi:6-phosphogluconolactonase (cycloisomerase 2 family)
MLRGMFVFYAPNRLISKSLLLLMVLFPVLASAAPMVTVISPRSSSSSGSPVFYEAFATSSGCAKGIAAMRIYTAPGVSAYTTAGAHIEKFITLKPGTYNTVVQAWDNCGGVGKTSVDVMVNAIAGVSLFLPRSTSNGTLDHVAASAQNPSCGGGISAMRIYTANGVAPYTIHANQLNAFVNLYPGDYAFTVQAWDKCGHVFKSSFNQSLAATSDGNLYTVTTPGLISRLRIANGVLQNPNGTGLPPQVSTRTNSHSIAADPGGWFVYTVADDGIYGFQVDQSSGALVPMPGSPFPGKSSGSSDSSDITVDPNGNFVFVSYFGTDTIAAYKIDRSTGALTNTATIQLGGQIGSGVLAVATDFYGRYLYGIRQNVSPTASQIVGYVINEDIGALTPVPGSPFTQNAGGQGFALSPTGPYLYAGDRDAFTSGGIFAYGVDFYSGRLTQISGSPFPDNEIDVGPQSLVADSLGRYIWAANNSGYPDFKSWFSTLDVLNGGTLGNLTQTNTADDYATFTEDHSGAYLYGAAQTGDPNVCPNACTAVSSFKLDSSGRPVLLSRPINVGEIGPLNATVAVTRMTGD